MYAIGLIMLFIGGLLFPIFMVVGFISIFNSDLRSHFGLFALGFMLSSGIFLAGIIVSNKGVIKENNTEIKEEETIIPTWIASNKDVISEIDKTEEESVDIKESASLDNNDSTIISDTEPNTYEPKSDYEDVLDEEPIISDSSYDKTSSNGGGNGENFNKYHNEENHLTEDKYVLNTDTMKIHDPDCRDVEKIKQENYETTNKTIPELIADGYTECGHCLK